MNLHDNGRPRIFHKPAFKTGYHIIPRLQIWPLGSEGEENYSQVELSLMLPVQDTRFAAHWKSKQVEIENLSDLIRQFRDDPERFVKEHFDFDSEELKGPRATPKSDKNGEEKEPEPAEVSVMEML